MELVSACQVCREGRREECPAEYECDYAFVKRIFDESTAGFDEICNQLESAVRFIEWCKKQEAHNETTD